MTSMTKSLRQGLRERHQYDEDILKEYEEVLHRTKFDFSDERIQAVIDLVKSGVHLNPTISSEDFSDPDDRVFYEVALAKDGTYMVTGNLKHFPKSPIVVTPAEMIKIITGGQ